MNGEMLMTLLGGLVVLAVLVGILWLLWHTLQHQGRLLLRIEAVESRLGQAGLSAQGADAIRGLVASAIGLPMLRSLPRAAPAQHNGNGAQPKPRPTTPAIGEPAPSFSLPSLEGKQVKLSDFRGHKTLVLFWRPSCGFCQRMLPDLKAWEKRPPQGAPHLVVVSSESVESNQAMKLRLPIVLDQLGMSVGSQFGAPGTPMAILVDEEGKIASALAAGAPPVLALMRGVQDTTARV